MESIIHNLEIYPEIINLLGQWRSLTGAYDMLLLSGTSATGAAGKEWWGYCGMKILLRWKTQAQKGFPVTVTSAQIPLKIARRVVSQRRNATAVMVQQNTWPPTALTLRLQRKGYAKIIISSAVKKKAPQEDKERMMRNTGMLSL